MWKTKGLVLSTKGPVPEGMRPYSLLTSGSDVGK